MNHVNVEEVVSYLSERIGIRFGGTKKELKAAYYIRDTIKAMSLNVNIEFFNFLGWEIKNEPILQILKPIKKKIECNSFIYSMGTPVDGIKGFIEKAGKIKIVELFNWDKYTIEGSDKIIKAYIVASSDNSSHSLPIKDPTILIPQIVISKKSSRLFDNILDSEKKILCLLVNDCKFKENSTSQNIVTEIEGRNNKKMMIVGGHYDTEYNCPGAWDNASGTAGLLKILNYFKNNKPPYTIRFVFFGAEEFLFLGAKAFVNNLIDKNELDKVILMINFDGAPLKKEFIEKMGKMSIHLYEKKLKVKEMLNKSIKNLGLDKYFNLGYIEPPLPNSDHHPFYKEGIPCIKLFEADRPYIHYHTPHDTIEKLDFNKIKLISNFLIDFIKNFEV